MEQLGIINFFRRVCDQLANADDDLAAIIQAHGYPPMWTRPNSFETLVHIILEQQVSLASALGALEKLREKTSAIIPENILKLTDEELKACYVSRQKIIYIRNLALEITEKRLSLSDMEIMSDEDIRIRLTRLKGIGNWTTDVYLMFVLRRPDVFPMGDLAAVNALKRAKNLPNDTSREHLHEIMAQWSHTEQLQR